MLHFMLYQAALSLLAGAAVHAVKFAGSGNADISECPFNFYGLPSKLINVKVSGNVLNICFNNLDTECIQWTLQRDMDNIEVTIDKTELPITSEFHGIVTSIKVPGKCHVSVAFKKSNNLIVTVQLHNFGKQSGTFTETTPTLHNTMMRLFAIIFGKRYGLGAFRATTYPYYIAGDHTLCRYAGTKKFFGHNQVYTAPDTCTKLTCDYSVIINPTPICTSEQQCTGTGRCVAKPKPKPTTCTLTGNTIIDFFNRDQSVPDRCGYTLMRPTDKNVAFRVIGILQERRRKDLSFLNQVVLQLNKGGDTHNIYLEQGGRVRVDNKMLTLSATAQTVHDVELSKDRTGVTAKISFSNHMIPVFFDGYTVQIDMTGYKGSRVHGLCGVPGEPKTVITVTQMKNPNNFSCEKLYTDTTDSTIDCPTVTARCNLLKQEPFTACNKIIDPQPYITACTNVLCKYPLMDGLQCQFLEVYARTCMSHSKDNLDGWRAKASCSASPQAFCQDKFCSSHEFCGERKTRNGGTEKACLCRALYASKYNSTHMFGEQKVCGKNSASLSVARCLLEGNGINYSDLHLNDQSCKGKMDDSTHMVTFGFDNKMRTCGTVVTANKNQLVYKNTILMRNFTGKIRRQYDMQIGFSCYITEPDIKSMGLGIKIKDSSVIQKITSGMWTYSLTMNAYTDSARTQAITSSTEIQLDQIIWVELKTDGLDDKTVAVVTDSCWATNKPSSSGSLRYDLIINGCANPDDQTVKVEGNGLGTSNYFSFNMFQFSGETGDVYLHCQLKLCVKKGNTCVPTCGKAGGRRRRSPMPKYEDEYPALITIAWTK